MPSSTCRIKGGRCSLDSKRDLLTFLKEMICVQEVDLNPSALVFVSISHVLSTIRFHLNSWINDIFDSKARFLEWEEWPFLWSCMAPEQVPEKVIDADMLFSRTEGGKVGRDRAGGWFQHQGQRPRCWQQPPPASGRVLTVVEEGSWYHRNTGGNISSGCKTKQALCLCDSKLNEHQTSSCLCTWSEFVFWILLNLLFVFMKIISDAEALIPTGLLWTHLQGAGWIHGLKYPVHLN